MIPWVDAALEGKLPRCANFDITGILLNAVMMLSYLTIGMSLNAIFPSLYR
jgi:hypothetical protein